MRQGVCSGLLVAALWAPALAPPVDPVDGPCACVQAACCCGPKRPPARGSCHGVEGADALLRCHHRGGEMWLTATPALVAARATASIAWSEARVAERLPETPRAGFSRIDLPPPRPPHFAS